MEYTSVIFKADPIQPVCDILTARLAELGFDSFTELENGMEAFIPTESFNEAEIKILPEMSHTEWKVSYEVKKYEDQNWNAVWEAQFDPIEINDFVRIRAPFHKVVPGFSHEILIQPKMSFGTGHHQTTHLIMQRMQEDDWQKQKVLDMGCGTGILAILAELCGAEHIDAIDIDPWSFDNTQENIVLNNCNKITALLGGKEVIPNAKYNTILANI
ncbi:MAG: 50S ribosomal protein L11 methyltransferase, partial [Flavobacteriales bacterium]